MIENSFGILVSRWRILGCPLEFLPDKAVPVGKACVCLHKYLTCTDADAYISPGFADSPSATGEVQQGEWRGRVVRDDYLLETEKLSGVQASTAAQHVRQDLTDFFQTPEGLVPWQETVQRGCLL